MGTPQSVTYHGRAGMKVTYDGMAILQHGRRRQRQLHHQQPDRGGDGRWKAAASRRRAPPAGSRRTSFPRRGATGSRSASTGLYTNDSLQSDNLSDDLRARGLTTIDKMLHVYDAGVTLGGPIRTDRLWFFAAVRCAGQQESKAGHVLQQDAGHAVLHAGPRPARRSRDESDRFYAGRVTWQASPKNKVNFFTDLQNVCRCVYEGVRSAGGGVRAALLAAGARSGDLELAA